MVDLTEIFDWTFYGKRIRKIQTSCIYTKIIKDQNKLEKSESYIYRKINPCAALLTNDIKNKICAPLTKIQIFKWIKTSDN